MNIEGLYGECQIREDKIEFMRLLLKFFRDLKLRAKFIISYILLITVPAVITGFIYYNTSSEIVLNSARQNIYEIVKKNNQIIDIKLSQVQESTLKLILDKDLYNVFYKGKPEDNYELLQMDRMVIQILDKYLSQYEYIYSSYIVTRYFPFGKNDIVFSKMDIFYITKLYSFALESKGKLQWVPTYHIKDMFGMKELEYNGLDYPYLFSAVKKLNLTTVEIVSPIRHPQGGFEMKSLEQNIERPVLVINFKEDMFKDIYKDSIPIKGAYNYIINEEGKIISHPDRAKLATYEHPLWLDTAKKNKSGSLFINVDGKKMLVCYDTLNTNGWISAVMVSVDNILSNLPVVRYYSIYLGIVLTILAILLAFIISGWIANPLKKLLVGISRMGEGNFDTKISIQSNDEIGLLVHNFNDMNKKIQQLIEENYETKIREKEAQIMALNLQLNPHFLSNTLNTINWMAIESNQKDISKMIVSLSAMLQYTLRNSEEIVYFKDDMEWLKNYVFIMSNRYSDVFTVEYDFDSLLFNQKVPKLFLQPFVENSIIHGFETVENGGIIKITGKIEGNTRCFYVEDNGKGLSAEKINEVMNFDGQSIGIKNIDKRVKLIYGEKYGVLIQSGYGAGTRATIIIPSEI